MFEVGELRNLNTIVLDKLQNISTTSSEAVYTSMFDSFN